MSDTVISVENLSKQYLVGHQAVRRERSPTLREVLVREVHSFARKTADAFRGRQIVQGDGVEEFWALRNVSFDVKEGEVIGIIGGNGAGKSTLLKILSRITGPTEGRVVLRGRVASLLEVGTGFHSELSGRENIFLNGAILGMSRQEIRKKFDQIVAFADVERFLDTPVKRYSSGMYVRLAFAVAAHLEPEILVVDEVLAVGDAEFQKKCLGRMSEVAKGGRTILFVSHNMTSILQLTTRSVLLARGNVEFNGPSSTAVEMYMYANRDMEKTEFDLRHAERRFEGNGDVRILSLRFNRSKPHFAYQERVEYIVRIRAEHSVNQLRVGMTVFARDGTAVGSSFSPEVEGLEAGRECELIVSIPSSRFAPGSYFCALSVGRGSNRTTMIDYDIVTDTLHFKVEAERTSAGSLVYWHNAWGSIVFPELAIERAST